jgi:hypothetical protein
LAFQDRDLMPQSEDLDVLVLIAREKKPYERERVHHRQIGQSPQHSRASCRDDRHAVAFSGCIRATNPETWSH